MLTDKTNCLDTEIQDNTLVKLSEIETNPSVQKNVPYQNQQTDQTIHFWDTNNSVGSLDIISKLILKYSKVQRKINIYIRLAGRGRKVRLQNQR